MRQKFIVQVFDNVCNFERPVLKEVELLMCAFRARFHLHVLLDLFLSGRG
ncbi:MAG: hypothetical protein OSB70_16580 [Myxococcota bacterium]|nr:hypothetical protein [Myxococcota bacterium]